MSFDEAWVLASRGQRIHPTPLAVAVASGSACFVSACPSAPAFRSNKKNHQSAVVTGFRLLSAEMAGALMICCAVLLFGLDYGTRICFLGEGHVGLGLLQVSCRRHGVGAAGT
jgi:hypothetical protein